MPINKEVKQTSLKLHKGEIILYPTDTVWGLGCDATNEKAVEKIYNIKQREASKSLIILVDSFEMLQSYIEKISEHIKLYLSKQTIPTTVIYKNPKGLAKNTIAKDNTIAIRIVNKGFAFELIKNFGKPIISTSANISGEKTAFNFNEISLKIKEKVDYIVHHKENKKALKSSKIIRFVDDKIEILRK